MSNEWLGEVWVKCDKPIRGSRIIIKMSNQKLAISDVQVYQAVPRPDHLKVPSLFYADKCARRNTTCKCKGIVYFGWEDDWVSRDDIMGEVACNEENFDSNGLKNKRGKKDCKCFSLVREEYGEIDEHPFVVSNKESNQSFLQ